MPKNRLKHIPEKYRGHIMEQFGDCMVSYIADICLLADDYAIDRDYLLHLSAKYLYKLLEIGTFENFNPYYSDETPKGF